MVYTFISIVQLFFYLGYFFILYRSTNREISDSIFLSIASTLIIISTIFQISFLMGNSNISYFFEIFLFALSINSFFNKRFLIQSSIVIIYNNVILNLFTKSCFFVLLVLFIDSIFKLPMESDVLRYHLPRVLLFQQNQSLFLDIISAHQSVVSVFPLGHDILAHLFLRNYSDLGIGFFGFLYYLSILFGTYSISKIYTGRENAFVVSMVICSTTVAILHSVIFKNDIACASASLLVIYSLIKLKKDINSKDLSILIIGSAWGMSIKSSFILYLLCLFLVFGLKLIYYGNLRNLVKQLSNYRATFIFLLIPTFIISNLWLYIYNLWFTGGFFGPESLFDDVTNKSGVLGALANLFRFAYSTFDYTKIPIFIFNQFMDLNLKAIIDVEMHKIISFFFQEAGMAKGMIYQNKTPSIYWHQAWYGPAGFIIIIPAIFKSLFWKSEFFIKGISISLILYCLILLYIIGWQQWTGRLFSVFFLSAGLQISLYVNTFSKKKLFLTKGVCLLLLFYVLLYSKYYQTKNMERFRMKYSKKLRYENQLLNENFLYLMQDIPKNTTVGLLTTDHSSIYAFMLNRPDLKFIRIPNDSEGLHETVKNKIDYVFNYFDRNDIKSPFVIKNFIKNNQNAWLLKNPLIYE